MIAKSSRRVVIINNIKSDKIEQAIFILRGGADQKPDRFIVREAQEIIDNYMRRIEGEKNGYAFDDCEAAVFPKKKTKRRPIVKAALAAVLLLASIVFIKAFL